MEERIMNLKGFSPVEGREVEKIGGGLSPELIGRIIKYVSIILDVIENYGGDFMSGYKKGVAGKQFREV